MAVARLRFPLVLLAPLLGEWVVHSDLGQARRPDPRGSPADRRTGPVAAGIVPHAPLGAALGTTAALGEPHPNWALRSWHFAHVPPL
ncbi:hypothetical protein ACWDXT_20870 [Streptomyces sp. NPDC003236]